MQSDLVVLFACWPHYYTSACKQTRKIALCTCMKKLLNKTCKHASGALSVQVPDRQALQQVSEPQTFVLLDQHNPGHAQTIIVPQVQRHIIPPVPIQHLPSV